jgi:hypothetical protein
MLDSTHRTGVDEAAAFQELCGSHGGMGGTQSEQFIIYPTTFDPPSTEIVGAQHVHPQFRRWLAQLGHAEHADLPADPNRLVAPSPAESTDTP